MTFLWKKALWREYTGYEEALQYLHIMQSLLDATREFPRLPALQPIFIALDGQLRQPLAKADTGAFFWLLPGTAKLSANWMHFSPTHESSQKVVLTAIAIRRYQLRHGRLPEDLNALVPDFLPAIPTEPFHGTPLEYQINADGTFQLTAGMDEGKPTTPSNTEVDFTRHRRLTWPAPLSSAEFQKLLRENPPASEPK